MDNEALVLDLVEWVAEAPRSYAEVMPAWRTSCPRLTIWEDAVDAGLVRRSGSRSMVEVTAAGLGLLARHPYRPESAPDASLGTGSLAPTRVSA